MEYTAEMIARLLSGTVEGNPGATVNTIAKIEEGIPGALSFLANPKYEQYVYSTGSSVVLVRNDFKPGREVKATLIRVEDPYQSVARLLQIYEAARPAPKGIHPTAVIDETAVVGEDVYLGPYAVVSANAVIGSGSSIYPHTYVGDGAKVGRNCTLHSGVRVYSECVIGDNCILHSGAVIGADGFGFAPVAESNFMKIPQIGNVVIEDNVEIGANTCIDRATMGSTVIRSGVKLDNLVQVGHNVVIGENTVIAGQTGIAGSTKVGKNCMIGGQVGIVGHLTIADGCRVGAQTGIIGSVREEGSTLVGTPSLDSRKFMKSYAWFARLPELNRKVDEMAKTVEELKAR
ncbi:MAG: UDP-3-O-(3-hydroxymyristoyl)glucosamine N-acyltransferase [Bacteroidales bacterium]|jgi:UDP-3-O-[3-hydroxymyristoyl] glucosamine N-acyltransferase|nr:UDP-3-O-(3-hydroxymyristoyl)glucosamine N-acyltransferase [Bacteroidales bacterium]